MSLPKPSFKKAIQLIKGLEKEVNDLERLLSSAWPIPEDLRQIATALLRYCTKSVRRVEDFRRCYRESAVIRFFDWIWLGALGIDQIAQHERRLEDCGKAVTLTIGIVEALSIAQKRRTIFNFTKHDSLAGMADDWRRRQAGIIQQDVQCQVHLQTALQSIGGRAFFLSMRRARVDLTTLRRHAKNMLHPKNPSSISTISSSSSSEPLQNKGYPRHPRQPYPPSQMTSSESLLDVHAIPEKRERERGPPPYYPYARNPPTKVQSSSKLPRIVPVSPRKNDRGRPLYYPCEPRLPARARSPSQFPRRVDLRERESEVSPTDTEHGQPLRRFDDHLASKHTKSQDRNPNARRNIRQPSISIIGNEPAQDYVPRGRRSTSANRGMDLPTVSDHGMVMNERQSHPPQQEEHNTAPTCVKIKPRQSSSSRNRRRSRSRRSDNKQAEYQNPARESSSTYRRDTDYVDQPSTHRRLQTNNNIHPQSSSGYDLRQTERRKRTSRSRSVSPEDEQHTRRRTSRSRSSPSKHDDHQQTERGKRSSRSRSSSSISQGDKQQKERSMRASTSSSGPLRMSHDNRQQTERRRRNSSIRSSYDSGIYVTTNSSLHTAFDRPLPREPNVNRATRPPTSTAPRTSRRTSSTSIYDSGVFMSNTASYKSRSGSADRNSAPESPMPRQSDVLRSYPPSSCYFDEDRPTRPRRYSKNS